MADSKRKINDGSKGTDLVILESYAMGTPVIASNLGNVGNMIEEGITRLTFDCGDVKVFEVCKSDGKAK